MTTLTIYDPKFKNPRFRRLQTHTDMEAEVAREMVDAYLALDYPASCIELTTEQQEKREDVAA